MSGEKQTLYLPKGTDNPFRATNFEYMTTEELLALLPFYNYSLRGFIEVDARWTEEARCMNREDAYQMMKALKSRFPGRYYVIVQMLRLGKEGREKPVVFSDSRSSVERAMREAQEQKERRRW